MITITQASTTITIRCGGGALLARKCGVCGIIEAENRKHRAFRNNGRIVLSEMEYRLLSSVTKTTEYSRFS